MGSLGFRFALSLALCWILVATIVSPVRAKAPLSQQPGMPGQGGVETDLISLLSGQARESQYLQEAYELVEQVQISRTCNQLAAYQLLTSCKSLEVGPDGTESPQLLEKVKNLYAARLAVCELQSAHASVPTQCKDIMSVSLSDLGIEEEQSRLNRLWCGRGCVEARVLNPCLKALHDKSTSWTSYSNNRAQAFTMCHAIRDHLEREHTAETHRKLVKVVSKMTDETSEVSRVLSETQQRHAATHLEVQDLFESFMTDVHGQMEVFAQRGVDVVDLLSDVTLFAGSLQTGLDTMALTVENANNDVEMVRRGVTNILQPVVDASSEISSYLVDMKAFMELAEPFLWKGTEVAHVVNDGWQQVKATHSAIMSIAPKLAFAFITTMVGRLLGVRYRILLLVLSLWVYGTYAFYQMKSMLSCAKSSFVNFSTTVHDWALTNEDAIPISGLIVLAITFAIITYFWAGSIKQARRSLNAKQEEKALKRVRRHDRQKNLAIDLGLPKQHQDLDSSRFRRAETVPLQSVKSEWV